MTGTHADMLPVWVGLTVVAGVALAAVFAVPGSPPPDATGAATTLDAVAAGHHAAFRSIPLTAAAVRVRPTRIALRDDAGTAHAALRETVTPARTRSLRRVLHGAAPASVYGSRAAFRAAAGRARANATDAGWRSTHALAVRHVALGGGDVTLVR